MKFSIFGEGPRYTDDELMARLKVFIGGILGLTLFGIVFVVLYSLIFVTQPLTQISPLDTKFFELIIPLATFLTGTLSGIMLAGNNKEAQMKALEAATRAPTPSAPTPPMGRSMSGGGSRPSDEVYTITKQDIDTVTEVLSGFGGKPAPAPAPQPLI
jgi:hypothetical protein